MIAKMARGTRIFIWLIPSVIEHVVRTLKMKIDRSKAGLLLRSLGCKAVVLRISFLLLEARTIL